MDRRDRKGLLEPDSSLAACIFSSSALLTLLLVLIPLSVLTSILGFRSFAAHIPFSGSCSWVISAACHPNPDEPDPATGRVKWGSISDRRGDDHAVGHCSFSCEQVTKPKTEKKICVIYTESTITLVCMKLLGRSINLPTRTCRTLVN
jgi:hypothetical protein